MWADDEPNNRTKTPKDREENIDKAVSAIENSDKGHVSSDSPDDVYYARCVDDLVKKRESTADLGQELQRRRLTSPSSRRHTVGGDDDEGVEWGITSPPLIYSAGDGNEKAADLIVSAVMTAAASKN